MATVGRSTVLPLPAVALRRAEVLGLARRALGFVSLAGLIAGSLVLVTAAASHPLEAVPARLGGFPGWLRGPLSGLGYVLSNGEFATWALVMTGSYLLALLCAPALRARWVIGTIVVIHLVLVLGPPLISSDVFGYLDWARMGVLHGLNPYSTQSGAVVSDPVYGFVRWHMLTSPYGPLFTLGTYALVPLGLPGSLWAFKILVVLCSLGCVWLIWHSALALGRSPLAGALLYGLNPAVALYTVGGFHNDAIMMVVVLGAVYLVVSGREATGAMTGALAVAVKSSAGLFIPFLVLGSRDRRRSLIFALATGVGVLVIAWAIFGAQAFDFINVLATQQKLNSGSSVPAQLGTWLGWTGSPTPVRIVASVLGISAIAFCIARAWRGADWIDSAGWATVSLMLTSSWLLAWYIVWLVPLAALARSRALRLAAVGMTLFVILVRMVPQFD